MRLNIQDSAKFAKVSRPTIYAKLKSGELSKSNEGLIDTAELLRVFGNPSDRDKSRKKAQLDLIEEELIEPKEKNLEVEFLKEKVRLLEANLADARNREEWLKGQVEKLTEAVKHLEPPKPKAEAEIKTEPKQEKGGFFSRFLS